MNYSTIIDFHEWHIVFATEEEAEHYGHPNAPYLADYGLNRKRFIDYVNSYKSIGEKRDLDKFDKILNTLWFLLFSFGPFIIHAFHLTRTLEGTFIVIHMLLITLTAYLCHKVHYGTYTKEMERLYDKDIELYISNLKRYQKKYYEQLTDPQQEYTIKEERTFSEEEINSVKAAVVVSSKYGNCVEFQMKTGKAMFIPLYKNSTKEVGESIDMRHVRVLTLEKEGEVDILRIKA